MNHCSQGDSPLKQNSSSFGQSTDVGKASTALTYNEQSKNVAEEPSLFHSGLFTPSLNDCDKKDMSNPPREMPSEEALSANTTHSPILVKRSSNLPKDSSRDYDHGLLEDSELIDRSLFYSPTIRWVTFPLVYLLLDQDDKDLLLSRLIERERLRLKGYKNWYLHITDLLVVLDFLRRYISEALAQVFKR